MRAPCSRHLAVPLSVATVGVLIGTLLGERILLGLSIRQFRYAIAVLIGLLGLWLVVQGRELNGQCDARGP